ncbi:BsuPI-related putative proteinase inhibitor [Bryobacter aggregatus]|uniref:BsuPI-related putative proteinase inhibitor n=1 Tax=Bryobacter aggregatus TaxID=360054 RepID=UPI0004E0F259|nr:BsuPI-related putative proteinase inhibitor [Bryobacter aggregatus]
MKQTLTLLVFFLASLGASAQDYFPLVPGSTWIYRQTSGTGQETLTLKLGESVQLKNKTYHRLTGYAAAEVLIRRDEDGGFQQIHPVNKLESPFLFFDGLKFARDIAPCYENGLFTQKLDSYHGPIGYFEGAATIEYSGGNCADTGLTSETFVPNLGLVRRAQTSFTGERVFELIYAQIGGITYLNEAGVSASISVTNLGEGKVGARLTLTNRNELPLILQFASGQIYDFIIRDEAGEVAYRWSADKLFTAEAKQIRLFGEEVWQETLPFHAKTVGLYSVEAVLMTRNGQKFSATASLSLP